jgi:VanZ family protein
MNGAPGSLDASRVCSRRVSIVLFVVVLLAVLGLSLYPRPEQVLGRLSVYDKAGHLAAYVVLGYCAARAIGKPGRVPFVLAVASCAALGGLVEVIQPLVGRRRELADFLVDLAGAVVGVAVAHVIARLRRPR